MSTRRPRRTVKYRLKQIAATIVASPFVVILFFSFYAFMTMGTKTTVDSYRIRGIISSIRDSKFLEIKFQESDKTFTIYRASRDYSDIKLSVGDTVTVYTDSARASELIQVEENGSIIYSASEFRNKYIFASLVSLAGGVFFIYRLVLYWRK